MMPYDCLIDQKKGVEKRRNKKNQATMHHLNSYFRRQNILSLLFSFRQEKKTPPKETKFATTRSLSYSSTFSYQFH